MTLGRGPPSSTVRSAAYYGFAAVTSVVVGAVTLVALGLPVTASKLALVALVVAVGLWAAHQERLHVPE